MKEFSFLGGMFRKKITYYLLDEDFIARYYVLWVIPVLRINMYNNNQEDMRCQKTVEQE